MKTALWLVDVEHGDGSAANRRDADKSGAFPAEMRAPFVASRIKKAHNVRGRQIQTRDIVELETITVRTSVSEIFRNTSASMLSSDDVIANECYAQEHSGNVTILTPIASPLRNELFVGGRHRLCRQRVLQGLSCFGFQ